MESSFFEQVYGIVKEIPEGKVATYGQIARMLGRPLAARFVGFAMGKAPSGLPCHRVVNQQGVLAPRDVFGAQEYQRQLLEDEGITFLSDGRIDMKANLWDGAMP